MTASLEISSDEIFRFATDARHILEDLVKEANKMKRAKKPNAHELLSVLADLTAFAEYQGYDAIWKHLIALKDRPSAEAAKDTEALASHCLETLRSGRPAEEFTALPDTGSPVVREFQLLTEEVRKQVHQVLDIYLDVFGRLIDYVHEEEHRTVYLDSLDDCLHAVKAIEFPLLRKLLDRHRALLEERTPEAVAEIRRDLHALSALSEDSGTGIDVSVLEEGSEFLQSDLRVIFSNLHLLLAEPSGTQADRWEKNIRELRLACENLNLPRTADVVDTLARESSNDRRRDLLRSVAQDVGRLCGLNIDLLQSGLLYRDPDDWRLEKTLIGVLDSGYIQRHRTPVVSENLRDLGELTSALTELRTGLTALVESGSTKAKLAELERRFFQLTGRFQTVVSGLQQVDARYLMKRIGVELRHATNGQIVLKFQGDETALPFDMLEILENPLLELLVSMATHSDTGVWVLSLLKKDDLFVWEVQGSRPFDEKLNPDPHESRPARLRHFVQSVFEQAGTESHGRADFILRGLEKLRCSPSVENGKLVLRIPRSFHFESVHVLRSGDDWYLVPSDFVEDICDPDGKTLTVQGRKMLRYRDRLVMALSVSEILHGTEMSGTKIIVLRCPVKPVGIVADEIVRKDNVVVKSLDASLTVHRVFGGAVDLSDQSVAMMIDPFELGDVVLQLEHDIRRALEAQR